MHLTHYSDNNMRNMHIFKKPDSPGEKNKTFIKLESLI